MVDVAARRACGNNPPGEETAGTAQPVVKQASAAEQGATRNAASCSAPLRIRMHGAVAWRPRASVVARHPPAKRAGSAVWGLSLGVSQLHPRHLAAGPASHRVRWSDTEPKEPQHLLTGMMGRRVPAPYLYTLRPTPTTSPLNAYGEWGSSERIGDGGEYRAGPRNSDARQAPPHMFPCYPLGGRRDVHLAVRKSYLQPPPFVTWRRRFNGSRHRLLGQFGSPPSLA